MVKRIGSVIALFLVAVAAVSVGMWLIAWLPGRFEAKGFIETGGYLLMIVFVIGVYLCGVKRHDGYSLTALFSVFMGLSVAWNLQGTPFSFNGVSGDQGFATAFVSNLAHGWGWDDFAIADVPTFYPPFYFWILARISDLFNIAPYMLPRYGAIGTATMLPWLVRFSWGRIVSSQMATLLLFTLLGYQNQMWYKEAEWLSLILFIPWWIGFVWAKRPSRWNVTHIIIGGVIGGLLFMTYYYWFFIGGVAWLVSWVMARRLRMESPVNVQGVMVLGVAAVVSAIYWLPYLLTAFGGWQSFQNRWLIANHLQMPFEFLSLNIAGVLLLIGLIWMLVHVKTNHTAFCLLALLLGAYLWFGLGYVMILLDAPTLVTKIGLFIRAVLYVAAAFGIVWLWDVVKRRTDDPRVQYVPYLLGLPILLLFGQQFATEVARGSGMAERARETEVKYEERNMQFEAGSTVLTPFVEPSLYLPVYTFLPWNAYYTHPAARFHDRVDFLMELSSTADPDLFATALHNNEYGQIDTIWPYGDGTPRPLFYYADDNFPNGFVNRRFHFASNVLVPPWFEVRDSADPTHPLYVPMVDDLLSLNEVIFDELSTDRQLLIARLCGRFRPHIDDRNDVCLSAYSMLQSNRWDSLSWEEAYDVALLAREANLPEADRWQTEMLTETNRVAADGTNHLHLMTVEGGIQYVAYTTTVCERQRPTVTITPRDERFLPRTVDGVEEQSMPIRLLNDRDCTFLLRLPPYPIQSLQVEMLTVNL